MSERNKMYDSQCYELAKAFIADVPGIEKATNADREAMIDELAQVIQDAIENHLEARA